MSSIFIYSHVKTFLIDPKRQQVEVICDLILLILTLIGLIGTFIKIGLILIYFFIFQVLRAFSRYLYSLCKLKCKKSFCTSFINGCSFLKKIVKRTITYNFLLYQNFFIGTTMIVSYIFFLFSSAIFYYKNTYEAEIPFRKKIQNIWYIFIFILNLFFSFNYCVIHFMLVQTLRI